MAAPSSATTPRRSIGGAIPDRLATDYVMFGLERMLRRIERRAAEEVPGHYDHAHEPLMGGDNRPVAPLTP